MSSSSVAKNGSRAPRLHSAPRASRSSAGPEAVHLASLAGLHLDDWQQDFLTLALREGSDGRWSAFEVALVVPRQNGKGSLLEARQLAGLVLLGEQLQVHTAHEFRTAYEHFLRIVTLVESNPDIERQVLRVRRGAGDQAIEMRSGARLRFIARTGGSGRGLSGDAVYLDEAFALTDAMMGALLPTLSARRNPQIWYSSSAPLSTSTVLHGIRKRGIAGSERLLFSEWSVPEGSDPDDASNWAAANPAFGIRISSDFVSAERAAMPVDEFLRERLGIPEPLPEDTASREAKVPADAWSASGVDGVVPVVDGTLVLGVDSSPGGDWASIAVAFGDLSAPYVELIEHRQLLGWVPDRIVELVQSHRPVAIGIDGGGPAGALVGPIMAALSRAGISTDIVRQMSTAEMKQGCAGFLSDVVEGRLRRPASGQGPLDTAVGDACERKVGDAWLWDRRRSTVPIAPLVAATIARSLLSGPLDVESGPSMFFSLADA